MNYIWFDTGIEYQATKEHLTYLEDRYNIDITKERAKCPVPLSSKRYGVPFLSKYISEMIITSNGKMIHLKILLRNILNANPL